MRTCVVLQVDELSRCLAYKPLRARARYNANYSMNVKYYKSRKNTHVCVSVCVGSLTHTCLVSVNVISSSRSEFKDV